MPTDIVAKNSILSADAAQRKIRRMAFQVAEQNAGERELLVLGIEGNGTVLAGQLRAALQGIAPFTLTSATILVNKRAPQDARLDREIGLDDKAILVVDDVANSGKTLLYALRPLLAHNPRTIQTLVLVERSHKQFAVQPDYVGLSVSTTLQEHITVETDCDRISGAWLH
ncbi:phosphoribosyltransferase family protein [Flaviaesturariibacter amylovorans]|uniref:Phosphoribosyltransferase domain-containing protein n=1 Tax=Flaviaesturariibacter amylovorans TaxID=1084520 RepID=A0ABP8GSK3_9BACT